MNKERFEELKGLSVYGLEHMVRDYDDTLGAVDAVATDYRDMVAEIERLKNAIEFIYSYADGEFNGADGSDMHAHRRDLYTITQLCITALDGEPLTDDLIVKDEPAAAPDKEWTPKVGDKVRTKLGTDPIEFSGDEGIIVSDTPDYGDYTVYFRRKTFERHYSVDELEPAE